ncbi:HAD-superfamily hydrolase, subfamily IIB [Stanieria cyanosphaera PCC 7437]|uniref:HAD-superfamily hydrolase, subfamily IIB n=1 Tax=Stanieria cyanosphaera (strain ATCC 29371 / PCC 7437) TaxID=111780 RepID=K9XRR6_STAC7|nr:HAD family hydrolase [Stanieria cyanosphaera]AFZ34774.1 HAD-superfamily hydrolase, subfamily IIB [Stanieria cyanosphaera PCC 7437]
MSLFPINQAVQNNQLCDVRLVATDMDGTLTSQGKFTSNFLKAIEVLAQANIDVVIVTGRSAGWVNGIAHYLPIRGAIAENGGLFYDALTSHSELLINLHNLGADRQHGDERWRGNFTLSHRQKLAEIFQVLQNKFTSIQESADNCFRLTDWTFDLNQLTLVELKEMASICQANGWSFTYSNVQCHIKPLLQDKALGLQQILKQYFPQINHQQIITVGDSPNDESLFNQTLFPLSVGVANILDYCDVIQYQPTYITSKSEGEGFTELAELILKQKTKFKM